MPPARKPHHLYSQPHTALSLSVGLIVYRAFGTQCAPINLNQTCRRHVISLTPYGVPYGVSITHDCLACRRHATTRTLSFISHQCKRVSQHRKPISHQCGGTVWAENRPRITAKRIYCTVKRPRIIAKGTSSTVLSSRINARLFCSVYSAPRMYAGSIAGKKHPHKYIISLLVFLFLSVHLL